MRSPQPVWRITSPGSLNAVCWENDEHVVYHSGTGDTHLVDGMNWFLLDSISKNDGANTEQLCKIMGDYLGVNPDENLRQELDQLLINYTHIGLIEQTIL